MGVNPGQWCLEGAIKEGYCLTVDGEALDRMQHVEIRVMSVPPEMYSTHFEICAIFYPGCSRWGIGLDKQWVTCFGVCATFSLGVACRN